ncbi:hypothetical protein XU18_1265 [Perkinsela sp. CCAP 1560/4]|nr:hypothetical protein XU18_1265 [Perkinsela sp. CCAP 1560/4]|eukprot:KNH08152.1 hypothetical protein XU18_1265 [Perkinsela sp. CCAP 1560/4]
MPQFSVTNPLAHASRKKIYRLCASTMLAGTCGYLYYSNNPSAVIFRRSFHTVRTLAVICADYKMSGDDYKSCHRRCARRVYDLCQRNGGIYVKAAQLLCTANYSIPVEYMEELIELTDNARQSDLKDIIGVIEEDLGQPMDSLFSSFDPSPIGCASLAQVHRATLRSNGNEVVIKVQHPHLAYEIPCDYIVLTRVLQVVDRAFEGMNLSYLIEHTRKGIAEELDFINESRNMLKACELYASSPNAFCRVSVPWLEYTTKRLLTMEYMRGCGMAEAFGSNTFSKTQKEQIAKNIIKLFATMIFRDGFVHCDPHPGNMLIDRKTLEIILLDHGLYRKLDENFRSLHARLWHNLFTRNDDEINSIASQMAIPDFANVLSLLFTQRALGSPTRESNTSEHHSLQKMGVMGPNSRLNMRTVSGVLSAVPEDFLFVMKTILTVRSVTLSLGCSGVLRQRQYAKSANDAYVKQLREDGRLWKAIREFIAFHLWYSLFTLIYP